MMTVNVQIKSVDMTAYFVHEGKGQSRPLNAFGIRDVNMSNI